MLAIISKRPWVLTFILSLFLVLLRRSDFLTHPQFWAEDATIWFKDAYLNNSFENFFTLYGGYLHPIPRAVAAFSVAVLPLEWVPAIFCWFSLCLLIIFFSAFSLPIFRNVIHSDSLRIMLILWFFIFALNGESEGNLTNIQWYVPFFALILFNLATQTTHVNIWISSSLGILLGFSSTLNAFLVPLCVLLLISKQYSLRIKLTICSFICGIAIHTTLSLLLNGSPPNPISLQQIVSMGSFIAISSVISILGYTASFDLFHSSSIIFAIFALLPIFLFSVFFLKFSRDRLVLAGFFLSLIAFSFLTIHYRWGVFEKGVGIAFLQYPKPSLEHYNNGRYLLVPHLFIILFTGVFIDRWIQSLKDRSQERRDQSRFVWLISILLFCINVYSFSPFGKFPNLQWPKYSKKIESGWSGSIPINPSSWGWTLDIPAQPHSTFQAHELIDLLALHHSESTNIRMIDRNGVLTESFFEHAPNKISISVPKDVAGLCFSVGIDPRAIEKSNGVKFQLLSHRIDNNHFKEIFNKKIIPHVNQIDKFPDDVLIRFDASPEAVRELIFITDTLGDAGYDWALWINPRWAYPQGNNGCN